MRVDKGPLELVGFACAPSGSGDTVIACAACAPLSVSKCSEEIKNYIEERSGEDPLVKGVPEDKNPFKEKGGCVIA
ncbi:PREDICTED: guanine nucleotide-binding protein G(I)/G(S)/G(O) subunit gamma-11 [Nipponia nippon]|uniref:guanine nucleotide-binding protein G(I)/G(S)/G(O) subunit gamma-11 n=1 Tax=Nipponia nippon TaxID=128390 RepID=UPI000510EC2E|nr:PREDICTED: guanine nucleotide-binding protein G(I)/G(S)/G(O) subunit gamma-11 [Nipponia nippon]